MVASDIRHSDRRLMMSVLHDINWLPTYLYRVTQLKTENQAEVESLILSPGLSVVQAISWL
jgi:hypothetical protein